MSVRTWTRFQVYWSKCQFVPVLITFPHWKQRLIETISIDDPISVPRNSYTWESIGLRPVRVVSPSPGRWPTIRPTYGSRHWRRRDWRTRWWRRLVRPTRLSAVGPVAVANVHLPLGLYPRQKWK